MTKTFEVQSYRSGNWSIDSVHDDKDMAVLAARRLMDSRHHMAVRVIQETYDDESGNAQTLTVFKADKTKERDKFKTQTKKGAAPRTVEDKGRPPPKEKDFVKYMLMLVLSVGGILMALILGLYFLIESLG